MSITIDAASFGDAVNLRESVDGFPGYWNAYVYLYFLI